MSLNITATLVSDKLEHPIILPLSEYTDVEVDDNVHATCFKGVGFMFPAQDISGKIGYMHPVLGWVPHRFEKPLKIIADVYIKNKLLLQLILAGDTREIRVNGRASWIRVREVVGLDDEESYFDMQKRRAIHDIFGMDGFDATMTISV